MGFVETTTQEDDLDVAEIADGVSRLNLDNPRGYVEAEMGHELEWDPPTLATAQRWTCRVCGRALLRTDHVYGSALTEPCV